MDERMLGAEWPAEKKSKHLSLETICHHLKSALDIRDQLVEGESNGTLLQPLTDKWFPHLHALWQYLSGKDIKKIDYDGWLKEKPSEGFPTGTPKRDKRLADSFFNYSEFPNERGFNIRFFEYLIYSFLFRDGVETNNDALKTVMKKYLHNVVNKDKFLVDLMKIRYNATRPQETPIEKVFDGRTLEQINNIVKDWVITDGHELASIGGQIMDGGEVTALLEKLKTADITIAFQITRDKEVLVFHFCSVPETIMIEKNPNVTNPKERLVTRQDTAPWSGVL